MPAVPPAAETKKPAKPPPDKAADKTADKGKAGGKQPDKAGAASSTKSPEKAPEKTPAKAAEKSTDKAKPGASPAASGQQRFDRMAVRAKLAVSEPGDAVEREADSIAARVMRAPANDTGKPATPQARPEQPLQRKATTPAPAATEGNEPTAPADLIARLGAGAPLDADARAFFEQRLGRSLADVRVHTDEAAADAARSLQARAFTWGRHIAFASGEYQPASHAGRELIAHELAHVLQNDAGGLSHVVARKKGDNPRHDDPDDIADQEAFDPAKDKAARAGLETLKLPAIKARHADAYKAAAGAKALKRPKGYDRKQPEFSTAQVSKWNEEINKSVAGYYGKPGEADKPESLKFYGKPQKNIAKGDVLDRLRIPQWGPDGTWTGGPLQVDHVVEVQVGGADAFANYELLTGAHNTNVGSMLRASIYAGVKGYLAATGKNTGDALVKDYLDTFDIGFKAVEGGGEGKNLEKTSQFWSAKQIQGGAHLTWLKDEERPKKDDGNDKSRFALYSYTGEGFIDAFPLSGNKVAVGGNSRLFGITIASITLNKGFDKVEGGPVGSLSGRWDLPKGAKTKNPPAFDSTLNAVAGKPYAGALSSLPPPEVEIEGASPVTFAAIDFLRGKVQAEGTLKTEHELFGGLSIPVQWRGDDFALSYSIAGPSFKLPVPGLTVDESSVTLFFGKRGLGIDGSLAFSIAGLGSGTLGMSASYGKAGPQFSAKGSFIADRKLFDLATLSVGWSSENGFSGSGKLGITSPDKIKGVKSATLKAGYEKGVFSATGDVVPDVPGLKSASLGVTYAENLLVIKGELGIDEKVPCIESALVTVQVTKQGNAWKLGASGKVTPKLPGLSGSTLDFSYNEGLVRVAGEFKIKKGPLDGKVMAGVTNGPVDDKGNATEGGGAGKDFNVFGAADIKAEFIKDKLYGNLRLRLTPEGHVRVGGGFELGAIEVFPQIPKEAEFLREKISTPKIPIPGLGFSVGGVSVGLTFYAAAHVALRAAIGPGKFTGVHVDVDEFDPANADLDSIKVRGGGQFTVQGDAGLEVGGSLHLNLSAVIVELDGSVGITANVGIPPGKTLLNAGAKFTYSANDGLDLKGTLDLDISPELTFALKGEVAAKLNVLIGTITVWSHDWTLGEAAYKLPIGIQAHGELGYNSKSGKFSADPKSAIGIKKPDLEKDGSFLSLLDGSPAPSKIETRDEAGKVLPQEQLMCTPAAEPNASFLTPEPNQSVMPNASVMPAREPGANAAPQAVDEGIVERLGPGQPLDLATQGFFEQQLGAPLTDVRVHTGPAAQREAEALSARAFTVGQHIAFAANEYAPAGAEGRELLAHELAHVVQQQGGAPKALARLPAGPGSVTHAGGAGTPPATAASTDTPAQRVQRAQRELERFVVPASKRRHGAVHAQWQASGRLRHGANYEREADAPAQVGNWSARLEGFETRPAWSGHYTRLGLSPDAAGPQPVSFAGGRTESKTFADWVDFFKRPQWNHQGAWLPHRLEVDHVVELQTAGWPVARDGDTAENYELLDKRTNASAGGTIYAGLRQKMRQLVAAERNVPPEQVPLRPGSGGAAGVPDAETELRSRGVVFNGVEGGGVGDARGGGRRADAGSEFWVLAELQAGEHLAALHSPPAGGGGSGTAQRFLLLSAATGGMEVLRLNTAAGRDVAISGSAATRLASITLTTARLDDGYGTAAADTAIGSLQGRWRLPPGITPTGADPNFTLKKARDGQYNGYAEAPATLSAEATGLSPIEFSALSLDGAGINATGQLAPSVPLFAGQAIDVSWVHDDIRFSRTFSAEDLTLSVPGLSLDAASVTVYFNRSGFGAEGAVYFTLAHLGSGVLSAGVDSAGRFSAEGRLELDTRTFDSASLAVWYRDGAFGGAGHLGITQPGRIRGVNAASIDVAADAQTISATGNVQPAIPGVQNAALSASYGAERGLVVAGDLQLANVAGIREGSVHAEVQKQDGDWHLSAAGRAVPALPGIDSEITLSYVDGLFDGSLSVDYARGIFSGNVTVGVTNQAVSPDGEVTGAAPAEGEAGGGLSIYGAGSVTARLTDSMQGSVGVRVRPAGELLISGSIGIPAPVTVFDAYPPPERATRTLFSMPTVSVPLVGMSVGSTVVGVALTINGRVTGHAQVGPGQLTETELRVEDFNPAQPESLHITGDAEFSVGAEAGVAASLDAGISLGAAVINATAGINVGASATLAAEARPHVHLDWRAATGLALHADLNASLTPRLAFDVNGFAEVTANAFVTSFSLWRKDWNLARRELGSNLALRVHAPVDYYSDGRGVVFDPEQVAFEVPALNADTLAQLLNDEGGSEHVEHAAEPAADAAGR